MESVKTSSKTALRRALHALRGGRTIIYPTETVYGLGCDAANERAVRNVFQAKNRSAQKFVILLLPSIAQARKYFLLSPAAAALARRFMPGAVTLVAKVSPLGKKKLAPSVIPAARKGNASFRISSHSFANALVKAFGKPIVSTSANLSGKAPARSPNEIKRDFNGKIGLLCDGGTLRRKKPSTIVDCTRSPPAIIREGAKAREVNKFLKSRAGK
ncbi:TPA: threonylcarbamoyl-AMP synthase [Candidatus Micrarchaeota archaeon]|nr:threonylcarbamoyl-AMP synthase [Candidatus Micrarchaeota archaeon]